MVSQTDFHISSYFSCLLHLVSGKSARPKHAECNNNINMSVCRLCSSVIFLRCSSFKKYS